MRSFIHRPSLYVVPHAGFLPFFLNTNEHALEDCDYARHIVRSESIAERTPLLPHVDQSNQESLIFVQVCHSSWRALSQKTIVFIRGIIALYATTIVALSILLDVLLPACGSSFAFDARSLSFLIQTAYYWITAVNSYLAGLIFELISLIDMVVAASERMSKSTIFYETIEITLLPKPANDVLNPNEYRYWIQQAYRIRPYLRRCDYISVRNYDLVLFFPKSFRPLFHSLRVVKVDAALPRSEPECHQLDLSCYRDYASE